MSYTEILKHRVTNSIQKRGERENMIFKTLLAFGGTTVAFLFGGWTVALTILCVFMAIDIITGIMKGAVKGSLRSAIGYKGMLKKAGMMLVVILAHMLDLMVGGLPVFRTMAVYFYIGNEGLSILENLGQIGVPIPNAIAKYIKQLSKKGEVDTDVISNASSQDNQNKGSK